MAITATPNPLSFHINDINVLGDLQQNFKFEIRIFAPDGFDQAIQAMLDEDGPIETEHMLTGDSSILSNKQLAAKAPMITAYARQVSYPGRSNGQLEDHYQGWKTIYPGKMDFGNTLTIGFAERQNGAVLRAIQAWQELINFTRAKPVGNRGGSFQYTGDFKRDLVADLAVTMLSTDGRKNSMSAWYHNCWPHDRQGFELDMTQEDFVKPSVEFSFDWSEIRSYDGQ